jgi:hypothetical protein
VLLFDHEDQLREIGDLFRRVQTLALEEMPRLPPEQRSAFDARLSSTLKEFVAPYEVHNAIRKAQT